MRTLRHVLVMIGVMLVVGPLWGQDAKELEKFAGKWTVVGMERGKFVTGDLSKGGSERFANLTISANRVR